MDAAAAARERRKARLKNGADRLSKITGKSVDEIAMPKSSTTASSAASSAASTGASTAAAPATLESDDPPDVFPGEFTSAFSSALDHDNLLASTLHAPPGGAQPTPGTPGAAVSQPTTPAPAPPKRIVNWQCLHFVSMVAIGLYACWNEYGLWRLFVGVEVALACAKNQLDPTQEPGILRTLLQFVPPQIGSKLSVPLAAVQVLRSAYYDFCLLLFVWAGATALV